jgi:hypothetical protein
MKKTLTEIWRWAKHNRWTVILPAVGVVLFLYGAGCVAEVQHPFEPDRHVNADELALEISIYTSKFELATVELQRQQEALNAIQEIALSLATGGLTDWGQLLNVLIASGGAGLLMDNRRKNTVISAMKRIAT